VFLPRKKIIEAWNKSIYNKGYLIIQPWNYHKIEKKQVFACTKIGNPHDTNVKKLPNTFLKKLCPSKNMLVTP